MKGEKIAQLELLLRSHPEGLRRAEIARRLGVHRSTISRYVEDLSHIIDIYEDHNLIKIKQRDEDEPIELSVYESLALNLSAEVFADSTSFLDPHLATGLRKIGMHMIHYAPNIAKNLLDFADNIEKRASEKKETIGEKERIIDSLIDCWVSGHIAKILTTSSSEIEIAPYFIGFKEEFEERHPITVTGRLRHTKEISTISIDEIKSVQMLNETYTIPDNLKPFSHHIKETYDVVDMIPLKLLLREMSAINSFSPLIMGEPSFNRQTDGTIICEMEVENSYELLLRIIQSGTSIIVLEPPELRNKIKSTLENILSLYKD